MSIKTLDRDKKYKLIIAFLLFVGIAIKCYKFGAILDCTQSDEMGSAYDAWALLHYGTDRYGNSWPVYFNNYGEHGMSALNTYLCVLVIKLIGYSKFAIRLPALICSGAGAVFGCLLAGKLSAESDKIDPYKVQIAYAFLYAVAPYTYMASRFALDCNLMFSISAIFLYFMVSAYKNKSSVLYFFAGLLAGLTLYTYAVSYIVLPIMLALSLAFILWTKGIRLRDFFLFLIPLVVLATPLILVQLVNYFDLEPFKLGIFSIVRIDSYTSSELKRSNFFVNIISAFKVILWHDNVVYNTNKYFFTFYPMTIPFFFYGIYLVFKRSIFAIKNKNSDPNVFVALWIVSEMIAAGLMPDPNVNRMNGIFFAVIYCSAIGFVNLLSFFSKKTAIATSSVLIASYCVYFAVFLYAYFTVLGYQDITDSSMCPEVYERIKEDPELSGKVIASNMPPHTFIATALPSPDQINEKGDYVDELYTCYKYSDLKTLKEYFFNVGGMGQVYLVYRPSEEDIALMEECNATIERYGHSFYVFYWE